jgi:hypothetical protein
LGGGRPDRRMLDARPAADDGGGGFDVADLASRCAASIRRVTPRA